MSEAVRHAWMRNNYINPLTPTRLCCLIITMMPLWLKSVARGMPEEEIENRNWIWRNENQNCARGVIIEIELLRASSSKNIANALFQLPPPQPCFFFLPGTDYFVKSFHPLAPMKRKNEVKSAQLIWWKCCELIWHNLSRSVAGISEPTNNKKSRGSLCCFSLMSPRATKFHEDVVRLKAAMYVEITRRRAFE